MGNDLFSCSVRLMLLSKILVYAGADGYRSDIYALCMVYTNERSFIFVSAFSPLMVLIVALAGPLVLNETIHLGRYLHSNFQTL